MRDGFYDKNEISVVKAVKTTEKDTEQIESTVKIKEMMKNNPFITLNKFHRN